MFILYNAHTVYAFTLPFTGCIIVFLPVGGRSVPFDNPLCAEGKLRCCHILYIWASVGLLLNKRHIVLCKRTVMR